MEGTTTTGEATCKLGGVTGDEGRTGGVSHPPKNASEAMSGETGGDGDGDGVRETFLLFASDSRRESRTSASRGPT